MIERNLLIDLVTRAQQGDSDAFNTLFSQTADDFNYFALKLVRDENIAEDILQDAYVDIFLGVSSLKEPAAFIKWAKKIIYHKATAHFTKRTEVLVEEDEEGHSLFDDIAEENAEFIPEEALDKDELKNIIRNIINSLPEEQASAAMMFYFDEMSIKDIAEVQGVNENTVKSRLTYARKAIKAAVEDYEKKNGIKLRSAMLLPLLFSLFSEEKQAMPIGTKKLSSVMAKGAKKLADCENFAPATAAKAALSTGAKAGIIAGACALTIAVAAILPFVLPSSADEDTSSKAPTSSLSSTPSQTEEQDEEEILIEQPIAGMLIPEGATYSIRQSIIHDEILEGDGKTVRFPEQVSSGDRYVYGDYNYLAHSNSDGTVGWSAWVNDTAKTEYEPLLTMINGAPLESMQNTFANCENMTVSPVIPESVTNLLGCYQQCYSLKTAPVIPKNVTDTAYTFENCKSLEGVVVIHANPTSTNNMWQGTEHPLYLTGDSEMLDELTVSGLLGIFGQVYLLEDMPQENT